MKTTTLILIIFIITFTEVTAQDYIPNSSGKGAGLSTDLPEFSYILFGLCLIAGFLFWIPFLSFIWKSINDPKSRFLEIMHEHFAASIGIPLATLGSFFTVLVLRVTTGSFEFTFAGLQFTGASGPITLWILCLLAFVVAIKLLWPLCEKQIIHTDKS